MSAQYSSISTLLHTPVTPIPVTLHRNSSHLISFPPDKQNITHCSICPPCIAIVTQRHIPNSQPVIHPHHARAVRDLMQAFDAEQTSHSA